MVTREEPWPICCLSWLRSGEGCEAELLCLGGGGLAEAATARGIPVEVLPMSSPWDPRVLPPLRRRLVAGGFDIVHTHGMRANLPVRLVTRGLRQRPCLFTTVHSDLRLDYTSRWPARLYPLMDRATLRAVDEIVCASDGLRARLIDNGYPPARLTTVRSGLEMPTGGEALVALGETHVAGSVEAGTRPRAARVGTVARLVPVKDIPLLLEVAAVLRRTHPDVEVVIVGDGPERERLESTAAEAGLARMVRFLGRVEEARSLMADLDVYAVTSVFEGGFHCRRWRPCRPVCRWWRRRRVESRKRWSMVSPGTW